MADIPGIPLSRKQISLSDTELEKLAGVLGGINDRINVFVMDLELDVFASAAGKHSEEQIREGVWNLWKLTNTIRNEINHVIASIEHHDKLFGVHLRTMIR